MIVALCRATFEARDPLKSSPPEDKAGSGWDNEWDIIQTICKPCHCTANALGFEPFDAECGLRVK